MLVERPEDIPNVSAEHNGFRDVLPMTQDQKNELKKKERLPYEFGFGFRASTSND